MLSEMRAGFQIGAILFLPFLLVDIVVASVTLSIGMVQLPPAMVSAPFKILLFVLADGWNLTIGSLMKGFVDDARNGRSHYRRTFSHRVLGLRAIAGHRTDRGNSG